MTDPIQTLEAPLLFDEPPGAPDFTRFLERLNERLTPQGLRLHRSQTSDEATALFSGRDFHVLITPSEEPLPAAEFTSALDSPLTKLVPADFAALVAAHRGHIRLGVGDGSFPKTKDLIELEKKLGIAEEVKPAGLGLKTRVLHLAIVSLLDVVEPQPTAIHWRLSDLLLTSDAFLGMSDSEFPGALVFTPEDVTRDKGAQGQALIGFTARGTEAFCGRPVVLEPAPLDLAEGVDLVAELITRHADGSVDLTQAGEVRLSPTAGARVTAMPPNGAHPGGRVSVAFLPGAATLFDEDEEAAGEIAAEPALEGSGTGAAEVPVETAMAPEEPTPPGSDHAPVAATPVAADTPAEPPAAGAERVMRLGSLLTAAGVPRQAPHQPSEPDPAPAPATAPGSAPVPAPEPSQIATETSRRPKRRAKAAGLRRLGESGLERIYNPEPGEGMLRHLLIAIAIVLVAPLPGFVLLIVTLIRGPLPKLTFACALLALANVVFQASSYLSLLS